ncbi:hypothetical protein [Solibacillus cecembensis]|uniref:hypothetical protein n=1 Tax=Solibacillus cecembensis TaxID=459347 RepID=UPI003D0281CF
MKICNLKKLAPGASTTAWEVQFNAWIYEKTQKTPLKEIIKARKYKDDYLQREKLRKEKEE